VILIVEQASYLADFIEVKIVFSEQWESNFEK